MLTKRSAVGYFLLAIVTCGLSFIYWAYSLDVELKNTLDNDNNPTLDMILVFVTCGLYLYYLLYRHAQQISLIQEMNGFRVKDDSVVILLLAIIGLGVVSQYLISNRFNNSVSFLCLGSQLSYSAVTQSGNAPV